MVLGSFMTKKEAAQAYDRHVLSVRSPATTGTGALLLNFHPRNYLSPDGDLLPPQRRASRWE